MVAVIFGTISSILIRGHTMIIEDLEHRFQELGERIELVRSYL
jgi:hypothetical protein